MLCVWRLIRVGSPLRSCKSSFARSLSLSLSLPIALKLSHTLPLSTLCVSFLLSLSLCIWCSYKEGSCGENITFKVNSPWCRPLYKESKQSKEWVESEDKTFFVTAAGALSMTTNNNNNNSNKHFVVISNNKKRNRNNCNLFQNSENNNNKFVTFKKKTKKEKKKTTPKACKNRGNERKRK